MILYFLVFTFCTCSSGVSDCYIYAHNGISLGGTVITIAHTNVCAAMKRSKFNKLATHADEHYILDSIFRALIRGQWKWFKKIN